MKKTNLTIAAAVLLSLGCAVNAQAAIIAPEGGGWQIGPRAVVLCESLTLRQERSTDSEAIQTLPYGSQIIVLNQADGWAECVLGDSEDSLSGWVSTDFIVIDPAWYRTNEETAVFAWNDAEAPKVGVLDTNTTLPILKDEGDWLIVSLRGATGWINNPNRDAAQVSDTVNTETAQSTDQSSTASAAASSSQDAGQSAWFTVYAKDGSTAAIHLVAGATYEDQNGRTYVKQDSDGYYYCITTDTTYAFDPTAWTGEAYGENQFPDENEWTGADYGENQFPEEDGLTGVDYGENPDW